jgi:hypothetical protein
MNDDVLLVDRWLDGDLSEAERNELASRVRDDAAFRARFAEEARLQVLIAGLLGGTEDARALQRRVADALASGNGESGLRLVAAVAARAAIAAPPAASAAGRAGPVPRPTRRLPRVRASRRLLALALAACLAICIGGAWLADRCGAFAPRPPTLDRCVGEVFIAYAKVGLGPPAAAGASLSPGDAVVTGPHGMAKVRFPDGSVMSLSANTSLVFDGDRPAKRLQLERGELHATVAKQKPGRPMVIATAAARITVIGTRFVLAADGGTRLEVEEGRVVLAAVDAADGIDIAAGEIGEVAAGAVTRRRAEDRGLGPWAAALARVVPPTPAESAWERIGWSTDLWEARRRARAEGKPLLLWAGWGDPLAMASVDSLVDRRTWSDPDLQRLIDERFIVVAADCWFLKRRDDAVGAFFAGLAQQSQHPDAANPESIYCCDADGRLLGACGCGSDAQRVREMLTAALSAFAPTSAAIPDAGPRDAVHDPQPPAASLIAIASARWVSADGDGFRAHGGSGREVLWLAPAEWRALIPRSGVLGRPTFPPEVARKLARFALLDTTRGETSPWDAADVQPELTLTIDAPAPRRRLHLAGRCTIADATRSYAPRLDGVIELGDDGDIARFDLFALGPYREDGLRTEADAQLGIAIRLAAPDPPHGHPHGMRLPDYFAP